MKSILSVFLISLLSFGFFGNNKLFATHVKQIETSSTILKNSKLDTLKNSQFISGNTDLLHNDMRRSDENQWYSIDESSFKAHGNCESKTKNTSKNSTRQTIDNISQLPFSESFNDISFPPEGWTIDNLASQWSRSNSMNAGGEPAEAKFTYTNVIDTSRFISPVFDLSNFNNLILRFKYYYDYYAAGITIGLSTRTINSNWTIQWQTDPTGNIGPEEVFIELPSLNVDSVQFGFFLQGNLYNLDYWCLDDIGLFEAVNLDLSLEGLYMPAYLADDQQISGQVLNLGVENINAFTLNWQLDDQEVYQTEFNNIDIETGQYFDFNANDLLNTSPGTYLLKVWISNVNGNLNDDEPSNDEIEITIQKPSLLVPKKPLFEEFHSSSCAPSANFNSSFNPFVQANYDDLTLIKYPMNWPGTGDPYYVPDFSIRRSFYGVNATPSVRLNGQAVTANMTAITNQYNIEKEMTTIATINAMHSLESSIISVEAEITSYINLENAILQIAVVEKETTGNAAASGQLSFMHVLMKMLPFGGGTAISLQTDIPYSFNIEADLTYTNIEDFEDLSIILFLQDLHTKEVYQSAYSNESTLYGLYLEETVGGQVTGGGYYEPGTEVTITATPNVGYEFVNWTQSGNVYSELPSLTIIMPEEDLDLTANFIACAPDWSPNSNLQFNMQVIAQIMIDDAVSTNPNDVLGAFVGDECRGIGSPIDGSGLVFLSVGSNEATGEEIELKIWNSSLCEFCEAGPGFTFENLGEVGTFENPLQVNCITDVDLNLSFGEGYTWFSENLAPEDAHPNSMFNGLEVCNNDRLIGQSNFSVYYNGSWNGTITAMNPFHSYRMKLCEAQEYTATAPPAEITPIPLNAGYTWLGYLPQGCLAINEAMADFSPAPTPNDRLIGQNSFALFTGTEWIGSLTTLCPGEGYVIKLANESALTYPEASANGAMNKQIDTEADSPIGVMPEKNLQHSMTVLGQIELASGQYSSNTNDHIYAYINDRCVGMANPMETKNGLIFLSIGENSEEAQEVSFKIWLDEQQQLYEAKERISFVPLKGEGVFNEPFKFTLGNPVADEDDWFVGEPYPNPTVSESSFQIVSAVGSKLSIKVYTAVGQIIMEQNKIIDTKEYFLKINTDWPKGVYMYSIKLINSKRTEIKNGKIIIR